MPAHVRIMDLSAAHCNALRSAGGDLVVSVDNDTKTAVLKGTVPQVIEGLQAKCDEIREKDGAKAQNYRMLVGVRNRLEGEKELAEKGKSKTVEIVPNGASVRTEIPKVLDGLPAVTDSPADAPVISRRANTDKGVNAKPALPLTSDMRHNFADLAKNANTPAAREYWQTLVDTLPADEPSELFA